MIYDRAYTEDGFFVQKTINLNVADALLARDVFDPPGQVAVFDELVAKDSYSSAISIGFVPGNPRYWDTPIWPDFLTKNTSENKLFDFIVSLSLMPNETIAQVENVSTDNGNLVFGDSVINPMDLDYPDGTTAVAGTVVQMFIGGGSLPPGMTSIHCHISLLLTTTFNNEIQFNTTLILYK